jgi:uncharacterized OB-fold protein
MTRKPLRRTSKFTDVQEEIQKSGAALYVDKDGNECLYIDFPYKISYIHSYAEDTPFFLGLAEGKILGTRCAACSYTFATPRKHCQFCGEPTEWVELPRKGRVHSWTTCHYGSEAFLKETPYNLVLVEFEGANSLLLSRLKDCGESDIYVGMPVEARFADPPKYSITDLWFVPAPGVLPERRG